MVYHWVHHMLHILFQAIDADRVYIYTYMALSGYGEPTWYACLDPHKICYFQNLTIQSRMHIQVWVR